MSNPPAYPMVYCSTSWQRLNQMSGCNTEMHIHNAATSYTGKSLPSPSALPAMMLPHSSVGTFGGGQGSPWSIWLVWHLQVKFKAFSVHSINRVQPYYPFTLDTFWLVLITAYKEYPERSAAVFKHSQSSPCQTFATHIKSSQFTFHPSIVDTVMI